MSGEAIQPNAIDYANMATSLVHANNFANVINAMRDNLAITGVTACIDKLDRILTNGNVKYIDRHALDSLLVACLQRENYNSTYYVPKQARMFPLCLEWINEHNAVHRTWFSYVTHVSYFIFTLDTHSQMIVKVTKTVRVSVDVISYYDQDQHMAKNWRDAMTFTGPSNTRYTVTKNLCRITANAELERNTQQININVAGMAKAEKMPVNLFNLINNAAKSEMIAAPQAKNPKWAIAPRMIAGLALIFCGLMGYAGYGACKYFKGRRALKID